MHLPHEQGGLHGKKRAKKLKTQNGAKDSSKAYYDVYGQEVSLLYTYLHVSPFSCAILRRTLHVSMSAI